MIEETIEISIVALGGNNYTILVAGPQKSIDYNVTDGITAVKGRMAAILDGLHEYFTPETAAPASDTKAKKPEHKEEPVKSQEQKKS